jgi:hypothetical protein
MLLLYGIDVLMVVLSYGFRRCDAVYFGGWVDC